MWPISELDHRIESGHSNLTKFMLAGGITYSKGLCAPYRYSHSLLWARTGSTTSNGSQKLNWKAPSLPSLLKRGKMWRAILGSSLSRHGRISCTSSRIIYGIEITLRILAPLKLTYLRKLADLVTVWSQDYIRTCRSQPYPYIYHWGTLPSSYHCIRSCLQTRCEITYCQLEDLTRWWTNMTKSCQ